MPVSDPDLRQASRTPSSDHGHPSQPPRQPGSASSVQNFLRFLGPVLNGLVLQSADLRSRRAMRWPPPAMAQVFPLWLHTCVPNLKFTQRSNSLPLPSRHSRNEFPLPHFTRSPGSLHRELDTKLRTQCSWGLRPEGAWRPALALCKYLSHALAPFRGASIPPLQARRGSQFHTLPRLVP